MGTYKITIAGLERELELFPVSDKLDIAAFIMFGDVEITEASAKELLKICPERYPSCYEMARQGCKNYVVARKGVKVYMRNPIEVNVKSITTENEQELYLGEGDADFIKGKRVLIVDDVISTGQSLEAIEELVTKAGGNIVGKAAVLAEGDARGRKDIIYLEELPLFFK